MMESFSEQDCVSRARRETFARASQGWKEDREWTYPFLCAFLAWLCWDEFFDSARGLC